MEQVFWHPAEVAVKRVANIFNDFLRDATSQRLGQGRPRVLIVEDEDFDRYQLEKFLYDKNCEVIPCTTGNQALEMIKFDGIIDLAFLDLQLPGGPNGVDVMRELKKKWPTIHVIVITGAVNPALLDDARKLGYFGMVFKPLEEGVIDEIVDKHKLRGRD